MANEVIIELIARTEAAQGKIDALEKELQGVKTQAKQTNDATKGLTSQLDKMTGGAVTAFRGIVSGAKSGVMAMTTLKGAIAATGIGALVIAVGSLATYFSKTQEGAEMFNKITAGIGATINVVIDRISMLGKAITMVFRGEFREAANLAAEAVRGVGDEIQREINLSVELAAATDELEKREAEMILTSAKRRAQIEDLRLAAEDQTKSTQEQAAALREAIRLQREEADEQIAIARERARIIAEEVAMSESLTEDIARQKQAEAELFDLERRRDKRLKEMITRLNSLSKAEQKQTQTLEERIKVMKEERAMQEEDEALLQEAFDEEIERIAIRSEAEKKAHQERIDQQIKEGEIAQEIAEQKERAEKQFAEAKVAIAQTGLNVIGQIFGQESAAGKAAAVASATIDTYKAFNNALANTPLPPPGPQIAAGLTLAQGFAQVRNILSTQIPNNFGGGGGAGGGGAATPSLPNVSILGGNEAMTQATRSISELGKKPTRAFVVSGDVTNNQALDRRIERNASFG
jgi:hypothetical protein